MRKKDLLIFPNDHLTHFFPHVTFHTAFPLKYSPFENLIRSCSGYSFPELINTLLGVVLLYWDIAFSRLLWKPAERRMEAGPAKSLPQAHRAGFVLLGR